MSLILVTGATAQSLVGFFDEIAAINKNAPTTQTGALITDQTARLQGSVTDGSSQLVQMNFLIGNRMRSITVPAEPSSDTSNFDDLMPPDKGQGNLANNNTNTVDVGSTTFQVNR